MDVTFVAAMTFGVALVCVVLVLLIVGVLLTPYRGRH